MKTIIAKPVTIENFARYGEIQNLLNPSHRFEENDRIVIETVKGSISHA